MTGVQVLAIASEIYPLIKTGGLADVAGALPRALEAEGVSTRTLIPGYPAVMEALGQGRAVHDYAELMGGPARLLEGSVAGLDLLVLEASHLFDRPGAPYVDAQGRDWPDNAQRFAALSRAGADLGLGLLPAYTPDIVHAHDWQAGLAPAYLHYSGRRRPGAVMTVHNLAFQGQFGRELLPGLGLPPWAFTLEGVEYYGDIGYLKAGLQLCDRITTVSPTYAAEICTPEGGMGLDGLLRARASRLTGILNGLDPRVWDPAHDPLIPATYNARNLKGRRTDRTKLQQRFGLDPDPGAPIFAVISRLTWQKGLDLLLEAVPTLLAEGGLLVLLGSGDAGLEAAFAAAETANPGRIGCVFGYDEALAHQIQAGADALIVPSRFEPCGLTQLSALRYGVVPVVARVGGLSDTVIDASPMALAARAATGVQFSPVTAPMLENALRRASALFRDTGTWRRLQRNGMSADVAWTGPARLYAKLYRGLMAERAG